MFIIREFHYNKDGMSFNELLRFLYPISSRTLSLKLKKLITFDILKRRIIREKPKQVEYSLTKKGKALHLLLKKAGIWYLDSYS